MAERMKRRSFLEISSWGGCVLLRNQAFFLPPFSAALLAACGSSFRRPAYSGPLVAPETIPLELDWKLRVQVATQKEKRTFQLRLRKKGDRIELEIRNFLSMKLVKLVQEGSQVDEDWQLKAQLPIAPLTFLIDLHRIFFFGQVGFPTPPGVEARTSEKSPGKHSQLVLARASKSALQQLEEGQRRILLRFQQETVEDTYDDHGSLKERKVIRPGIRPIHIEYPAGYSYGQPQGVIVFQNRSYGYELRVRKMKSSS